MRIYFSGIGGVGIGPLAELACDAGYDVIGSDTAESPLTIALRARGATVYIGQTGQEIKDSHEYAPIDWFVYTAALSDDHPEYVYARAMGIRSSKRDELLATIIKDKQLTLIAVSGTHGKTTTTGMLIWVMQELNIPLSYSVGSTLSFGPSGKYAPDSRYFVYECDEFDRNMLHFYPTLSIITSLDHDHFDTYPTADEYRQSFVQFLRQSDHSMLWEKDLRYLHEPALNVDYEAYDEQMNLAHLTLPGDHNRHNAYLVERTILKLFPDTDKKLLIDALNRFAGTGRRFEKLADNLYSDYGHHPVEIRATLQLARELNTRVALVYQPHQNSRQHEIRDQYKDAFDGVDTLYWLPTYLSRERHDQPILSPLELTKDVPSSVPVIVSDLDDQLWQHIDEQRSSGALVLCMGAGTIDDWVRQRLAKSA